MENNVKKQVKFGRFEKKQYLCMLKVREKILKERF